MVNLGGVTKAEIIAIPNFMPYGFEFSLGAVIAVTLICIVSAIETVGDTSGTTKAGAGRDATDEEIAGATYADGLGTAIAAIFGGLPNTSFSQNVGIIGMTGIMSKHVVTIAGVIMIVCGLIPKIGALVASMPMSVLGGGVIVMFGMVVAAGMNMLSEVKMNRRNMMIIAVSLAVGLGLNLTICSSTFTWRNQNNGGLWLITNCFNCNRIKSDITTRRLIKLMGAAIEL